MTESSASPATLDGAVRLLIEVHNELVVDHEQTQEERTKGYDLMRRIDAFIDATSAPSEIARPCTCHPDDNPPVPCPKKYALTECREAALSAIAEKSPLAPADANGKRPRLFYFEEAEGCWCPADGYELTVANIIDAESFLSDGEVIEIQFKRQDMTDAEHDAIEEG